MHSLVDLPPSLAPLADFLAGSLTRVQQIFDDQLRSDLPPVSRLCRHVERYRGKMLRPTLVILSGLAAHPRASKEGGTGAPPVLDSLITRDHLTIAAVCEMVHMATLVHDDVLDEADTRRRGDTVNRLYGNEAAVILGDLLIASAYELCSSIPQRSASAQAEGVPESSRAGVAGVVHNPALAIGRASMVMCSGELLQLHHRGDYSLDEPTYFEIIERKTAELIATSAQLGAAQSGADEQTCARLADFGRKVGVAFQIQDDLLDLTGREAIVGKPIGKDLEKGKMTLPMIHHLANADPRQRGRTLRALEDACAGGPADDLLAALEATASLAYAAEVARRYVHEAGALVQPIPDNPAKAMLQTLAEAVVTRRY
jgi:octaprenyl-diphosphate synthase